MQWLDETGQRLRQAGRWPELAGVACAAAPVADLTGELLELELAGIERAVARRRWEFATGRHLARQAMAALQLPPVAIAKNQDRSPGWPEHCAGSITHAKDLVVVVVAKRRALQGLGIDLEEADRVTPNLHRKLYTADERARLQGQDERLPGLIFSAKEAVYKAVDPIVGRFIGFLEVEIDVDWPSGGFRVRYVGDHAPNRLMESGEGYFAFAGQYVMTLFIIR